MPAPLFYPQPDWHLPMSVAAVGPQGRPFFVNRVDATGRNVKEWRVNVRGGEYARKVEFDEGEDKGLKVEVLESDGVSSMGIALTDSTGLRASVFGPSLAFRSKPVSELAPREPMPRVHTVAMNGKSNAVAIGCADERAFVCQIPFPSASSSASSSSVRLEGHLADVTAAVFMPSDKVVVTGSSDMRLRVIDAATGKVAATLVHGGGVSGVAVTRESKGRNMLSCGRDSTLKLWQLPSTDPIGCVELPAVPNSLCLLEPPSVATAAAGSGAGAATGTGLGFEGFAAAVADDDGFATIVDLASQAIIARLPLQPAREGASGSGKAASAVSGSYESGAKAFAVSFDPQSRCLALAGSDGMLTVYGVSSLFDAEKRCWGDAAAKSPVLIWHGQLVATGAEVQSLQIIDIKRLRAQPSDAGIVVLAGLSEGTCGFFFLSGGGESGAPSPSLRCPVLLSGPNCEAVRAACAQIYPSQPLSLAPIDTAAEGDGDGHGHGDAHGKTGAVTDGEGEGGIEDSYLTVATACNDGFARVYTVPVDAFLTALDASSASSL